MPTQLLEPAARERRTARNNPPDEPRRHDQAGPQHRPDPHHGRVRAVLLRDPGVPVAVLRRLGAAAARGLPGEGRVPGGHPARPGGRGADLRRARSARSKTLEPNETDRAHRRGDRDRLPLRADPEDTRAILRQKTLLGETYVELSPGEPAARHGDMLRPTAATCRAARWRRRSSSTRSCARSTRTRASASPPGSTSRAARRAGTAEAISDALAHLTPFAEKTDDVLKVLRAQSAATSAADARHRRGLRRADRAPGPAARADRELEPHLGGDRAAATRSWPTPSACSRRSCARAATTTRRLTAFAEDANPLIDQLRPAARQLSPTLIGPRQAGARPARPVPGPRPARARVARAACRPPSEVLDNTRPLLGAARPVPARAHADRRLPRPLQARDRRLLRATTRRSPRPIGPASRARGRCTTCAENPVNPEIMAGYPNRLATNRSNPYTEPGGVRAARARAASAGVRRATSARRNPDAGAARRRTSCLSRAARRRDRALRLRRHRETQGRAPPCVAAGAARAASSASGALPAALEQPLP